MSTFQVAFRTLLVVFGLTSVLVAYLLRTRRIRSAKLFLGSPMEALLFGCFGIARGLDFLLPGYLRPLGGLALIAGFVLMVRRLSRTGYV